ncbi:hypothetical protein [Nocardia bovistercoris]|uniref:Uncharacterized protein n=1 Tax=Nocardia bovistercoris TaxID=2785916 RepID=A0A931N2J8_9NOCA|nr:hypothetical protein [Nocardia bovistercoris]MBH0779585.1 hypothetical protein [Nocardia bovistercoris]
MGNGKHRVVGPRRQKVGSMVVAGAVPVVLSLVGGATAEATPEQDAAVSRVDFGVGPARANPVHPVADPVDGDPAAQWPAAEVPNVRPYQGAKIPDDTLSSLQWARPVPQPQYLSPVDALHAPVEVPRVPPIAPPPGMLRVGDVQVAAPDWLPREQAIQVNDAAAATEAEIATFLDSVGMERTRSDRIAGQTMGAAAVGATAGAAFASPFALVGAGVGGALGLAIGLPFAPIGLAAGPMGAVYGAALMAAPLAAIGAGIGAGIGATAAFTAPPRAMGPTQDAPAVEEMPGG